MYLNAGKVADLVRSTTAGFAQGLITKTGLNRWQGQRAKIQFQNENLVLEIEGHITVTVPDLICCLDLQSKHKLQLVLHFGVRKRYKFWLQHPLPLLAIPFA